jgi:hypothetical protein
MTGAPFHTHLYTVLESNDNSVPQIHQKNNGEIMVTYGGLQLCIFTQFSSNNTLLPLPLTSQLRNTIPHMPLVF